MVLFDYFFYRIYSFYKKKRYIPKMMGIYFILVLQVSILFLISLIVNFSTHGWISERNMHSTLFWSLYCSILILLFIFNVIRYTRTGKCEQLLIKFSKARVNRFVRTWQIFLVPIFVILIAILFILFEKRH